MCSSGEGLVDVKKRVSATSNSSNHYKTSSVIKSETCSINVDITYADTWISEYNNSYSNTIPDSGEPQIRKEQPEDTEYEPSGSGRLTSDSQIDALVEEYRKQNYGDEDEQDVVVVKHGTIYYDKFTRKTNQMITTKVTTTRNTYIQGTPTVTEKTDKESEEENFVTLFVKSKTAKNNILSAPSWLFQMLESSPTASNMVDLVKYLLFKATGIDYGVVEFNFDVFESHILISVGGLYGGTIEEKVWFALIDEGYSDYAAAGVMGNLYKESTFIANNLQDDYESSLGHTNESYTEAVDIGTYTAQQFINDSAGYGLAQWTYYSRKEGLYYFAKNKEVSIADENMQIEYLLGEISPSGGADGNAEFQMGSKRNGYDYESWKDATSVDEATSAFCWVFENPGEPDLPTRILKANEYYNQFHGKIRGISSGGITTDEEAEQLQSLIENEWLHTIVHRNYEMQNGPFLKYWDNPINTLEKFQCTWWANGRASMYLDQMGIADEYPTEWGNGGDYYSENLKGGWFDYGQTPRPNSIISWTSSGYGHVAYVEGVTSDGIYISHAGSGKSWYGIEKIPLSGELLGKSLNGYIYLDSPLKDLK